MWLENKNKTKQKGQKKKKKRHSISLNVIAWVKHGFLLSDCKNLAFSSLSIHLQWTVASWPHLLQGWTTLSFTLTVQGPSQEVCNFSTACPQEFSSIFSPPFPLTSSSDLLVCVCSSFIWRPTPSHDLRWLAALCWESDPDLLYAKHVLNRWPILLKLKPRNLIKSHLVILALWICRSLLYSFFSR